MRIIIGIPYGVKWEGSKELLINGNSVRPIELGDATITVKSGKLSRIYNLTVKKTSGVDSNMAGKEILNVTYFDMNGVEVAEPINGVYVKKTNYVDGTSETNKVIVRQK